MPDTALSTPSVLPIIPPLGSLSSVRWLADCKQPHLYCSGSGRASLETAVSGFCQQVLLGINNSVWVWCLQMGWIPMWGSLWMAFPSVSALLFVPAFPLDRNHSGLIFFSNGRAAPSLNRGCASPLDMVSTDSISPMLCISANGSLGPGNFLLL